MLQPRRSLPCRSSGLWVSGCIVTRVTHPLGEPGYAMLCTGTNVVIARDLRVPRVDRVLNEMEPWTSPEKIFGQPWSGRDHVPSLARQAALFQLGRSVFAQCLRLRMYLRITTRAVSGVRITLDMSYIELSICRINIRRICAFRREVRRDPYRSPHFPLESS